LSQKPSTSNRLGARRLSQEPLTLREI